MRIVLGLWLVQAVSAGAAWLALSSTSTGQLILCIAVVMGVGLIAALWLWTALRDQRRLGEARRSERMANRTAELHAKFARQQAEDAARLRSLTQEVSQTRPRLVKAGFLTGGALGLAVALVVTQFFAIGLSALAFSVGGAAGYALRGWLHRRAIPGSGATRSIGAASTAPVEAPPPRGKSLRLLRPVKASAA